MDTPLWCTTITKRWQGYIHPKPEKTHGSNQNLMIIDNQITWLHARLPAFHLRGEQVDTTVYTELSGLLCLSTDQIHDWYTV